MVVGRKPENRFSGRHITYDPGISAKFSTVTNGNMISNSRAPSHHDAITQCYGSSQPGLTGHHTGSADFAIVGNLNKVVYFRSVANRCRTKLTPVNTTACTDFNAISNNNRTDLWDLDQASTIG
jgi:hypothetical protein